MARYRRMCLRTGSIMAAIALLPRRACYAAFCLYHDAYTLHSPTLRCSSHLRRYLTVHNMALPFALTVPRSPAPTTFAHNNCEQRATRRADDMAEQRHHRAACRRRAHGTRTERGAAALLPHFRYTLFRVAPCRAAALLGGRGDGAVTMTRCRHRA